MCLYPITLRNKKYTVNKKNGGQVPPVYDNRLTTIEAGCGRCIECKKKKAREWQARLGEEIKENKNGKFVTLTFNNEEIYKITKKVREDINRKIKKIKNSQTEENKDRKITKLKKKTYAYGLDNAIATYAVRHFLERWRKEYKTSVKHWLVTELGHQGTENIHLHGIIWTNKINEIERIWKYGWVWKGKKITGQKELENYVSAKTINYIIKYVTKTDEKHPNFTSKILTSPGIGRTYTISSNKRVNKFVPLKTEETYKTNTGHKIPLPTYWKNKIYTEEEREKLWIEKLNKNKKYILGQEVDMNKGTKEYNEGLKYAKEINRKLGYQDNKKDWEKIEEEITRRIEKQKQRTPSARSNQKGMD